MLHIASKWYIICCAKCNCPKMIVHLTFFFSLIEIFIYLNFFFWESFNLWRPLLMIALYHQIKTPISFWCRRGLNPRSLIQPSETLLVELTGTTPISFCFSLGLFLWIFSHPTDHAMSVNERSHSGWWTGWGCGANGSFTFRAKVTLNIRKTKLGTSFSKNRPNLSRQISFHFKKSFILSQNYKRWIHILAHSSYHIGQPYVVTRREKKLIKF